MRRRHVVFVGLAILLASTMAVGTGADTVSYDDVDTLELQPAGGDNAYVDENGDGEIRIRVNEGATASGAGVNDNAITDLGRVFTVRNLLEDGVESDIELFIEKEDPDGVIDGSENSVIFYNADRGADQRIDRSGDSVTLDPGEKISVGVRIDTTGTDDPESVVAFRLMAHVEEESVFDTSTLDASTSTDGSSSGSDSGPDVDQDPVDSEVAEGTDGEEEETGDASESNSDPDSEQTDSGDGESSASTGGAGSNADGAGGDTQSGLGVIELAGFGSPLSLVAVGSSAVILSLSYIYRRRLAADNPGGWN